MDEEITKSLEEIGLTNAEAQVYTGLLKLGESKVGQIIDLVKVSSSNVHDALEKLTKKGLVSFVVKNNIKEYYPAQPKSIRLLLEKEKEVIKEKEKIIGDAAFWQLWNHAGK